MAKLLAASAVVAFFLALAALGESQTMLLLALIAGTIYFGTAFADLLSELPKLNLLRFIAAGTGLFYFLGGAFSLSSQIFNGSIYNQIFLIWRNFDPAAMSAASALVFGCTALTEFASRHVQLSTLGTLVTAREFYRGGQNEATRERLLAMIVIGLFSALCTYLLSTGELAVSQTVRNMVRMHEKGVGLKGVVFSIAPMMPLLMAWLLFDRRDVWMKRLPLVLATLPIWFAIFTIGRRAMVAAVLTLVIGFIVYRGVKMRPLKIVGVALAGAGVFFLMSGPFLELRRSGAATADQMLTMIASGGTAGRSMSTLDIAAVSASRMDIMSELAQVVSRYPLDDLRLGGATASHVPVVVPGFMWSGKQRYLLNGAVSDEQILQTASIPPTDLASSLVLFAYADFGPAAPIMFCAIFVGLLLTFDRMARASKSYMMYLMAISMVISYAVSPDATWGLRLFNDVRTMVGLLIITAITSKLAQSSYTAPRRGRLLRA